MSRLRSHVAWACGLLSIAALVFSLAYSGRATAEDRDAPSSSTSGEKSATSSDDAAPASSSDNDSEAGEEPGDEKEASKSKKSKKEKKPRRETSSKSKRKKPVRSNDRTTGRATGSGQRGGGTFVPGSGGSQGASGASGAGAAASGRGESGSKHSDGAPDEAAGKRTSRGGKQKQKGKADPAPAGRDAPYPEAVQKVIDVQNKHSLKLIQTKGVVGVATALGKDGKPVIRVSLSGADSPKIPAELDGVKVETELRGPIHFYYSGFAGSPKYDPRARLTRPVAIGVSGINFTGCDSVCATGTIGCRLRAKDGSGVYALSNNHVFADNNQAPIGSPIVQPGPLDINCACVPEDEVGQLFKFKQTDFGLGINRIDAAVIKTTTDLISNQTLPDGYGVPRSYTIKRPQLGMRVMKYGRTTGFTKGRIVAVNAFVAVGGPAGIALYAGQIECIGEGGAFGGPGDSGSLVVDSDRFPVGLLFAGGGQIVDLNPIQEVLDEFNMEIDGDDSLDFPVPGKQGSSIPK